MRTLNLSSQHGIHVKSVVSDYTAPAHFASYRSTQQASFPLVDRETLAVLPLYTLICGSHVEANVPTFKGGVWGCDDASAS